MTGDRKWWITILVAVATIPTWVYAGYVFDEIRPPDQFRARSSS
jgi:hypothetical protein